MVHYSSKPSELDNDDICWSKGTPSRFLLIYPKPLFISIHHSNAALFYPGFQTIEQFNPQDFEYSRGIELGKSTFFVFYDVSASNSNFDEKRSGISLLINSISPMQQARIVIFNNEARILQGFMEITHSSLFRMANDVCGFSNYGGTKPQEPFKAMRDYIFQNNLKGNDLHVIFVSDMKVHQSKKGLLETINLLKIRVRQNFNSFQLHMLDSSEDEMGRSDWMKEFACEFDGHYVRYKGNEQETIGIMNNFIKTLKYRMNALPVGTEFPFVKVRDADFGTFYPSGVSIVKPQYVDVSNVDKLFPIRHAWTFAATFMPGVVTYSMTGDGDPDYYPSPTIDKARKYVLDTQLGYQCSSFFDFTPKEQEMIVDSLNSISYDWRIKSKSSFCEYDRLIREEDHINQTYFCSVSQSCPDPESFNKQDYNFYIRKTCSSVLRQIVFVFFILIIIF